MLAADPQLSHTSVELPFKSRPADVIIQFEGSARWPDDMEAIQRTKVAFLLKIAKPLEDSDIACRVGLENEDTPLENQAFMDAVYPSGAAFRLRIHHDREPTLLERLLKDRSQSLKLEAATALASYKRIFIRQPLHTQAIQVMRTRHPSFHPRSG